MEEKKNNGSAESVQQPLMETESSRDTPLSEGLRKTQVMLKLAIEDFEKSQNHLVELERSAFAPLAIDALQKRNARLIEGLNNLAERAIDNYQYTGDLLAGVQARVFELENAIGESHRDIDARFVFWLHDFSDTTVEASRTSQKVPTFAAAIDEVAQKQSGYAYFLATIGSTQLLIGQYVPHGASSPELDLQVSAYVEPPGGHFRRLKRARNKLFASPNRMVLHLFGHSRPHRSIGTFKRKSAATVKPYLPHCHDDPDQLPKILYDFINFYGTEQRYYVHLLRGMDKFALFVATQGSIEFNGRFIELSAADTDISGEQSGKDYRLVIE